MEIRILPFLLYGAGVVSCFHTVIYEYHFINNAMTWGDARQYCRRHYTDLATFWSLDDVYRVERPSGYGGVAWIGLFDDPASWRGVMGKDSNSWRWSVTGSTSPGGFQNWATGQPDYDDGTHQCVTIRYGLWYDSPCSSQFQFACFTGSLGTGTKSYTLISTTMTWEQARSHCRERYTDLAMIENESENTAVASLYSSAFLWIGLYREPWRWSDGSQSSFTNSYRADSTNRDQHCVREQRTYRWNDRPCSDEIPFICQQVFRTKTSAISMKLQSGVDLSETEIHNQIIQQVGAELEQRGITDVNLKWKSSPVLFSDKKKIESQTDITCTNKMT